jgi:hypothetical protein
LLWKGFLSEEGNGEPHTSQIAPLSNRAVLAPREAFARSCNRESSTARKTNNTQLSMTEEVLKLLPRHRKLRRSIKLLPRPTWRPLEHFLLSVAAASPFTSDGRQAQNTNEARAPFADSLSRHSVSYYHQSMGRVQRKEFSARTMRKGCERPDLMQDNDGYVYVCVCRCEAE